MGEQRGNKTDEFVPYRPRLLGFHSLHVNAMKCIYIGFSLSKLQSFFWKISLNWCLIRLEGFNNKNSTILPLCFTLSSGKAFARCTEGPEFDSVQYLLSSFLLFIFFFSCSFHFRYNSFVMFLYIAHNFWLTNFLRFTCRSPTSPSRGPAIYVFLVLRRNANLLVYVVNFTS